MADDTVVTDVKTEPPAPASTVDAPAPGSDKTSDAVPYSRFKEVNDAKVAAETELTTMKADQELVRTKALKAQGDFETLNTELTEKNLALTEENGALVGKFKVIAEAEAKERETLLGTLPEDKRGLYDSVTDLPSLRTLIAEVTGASPPGTFEGHPGGGGEAIKFRTDMTPEEQKDWLAQKTAASLGK